jgi:hypothetical protein
VDNKPAPSDFEILAKQFTHFAEIHCRGLFSPLYEHLSLSIAKDPEILALAAQIPAGQPVPNLLFGAVHYLLLQGYPTALALYYRSLTPTPYPPEKAFPAFRDFCLENSRDIERLLRTRRVQTNEIRRCSYLFLGFSLIAKLAGGRPLALIEIGPSAGLNLMWNRYRYHYGEYGMFGDGKASVAIECAFQGEKRPPYPQGIPEVSYKVGLDINPIDIRDPEQALWLRALIWPEHIERNLLLEQAIEIAKQDPPKLLAGDGIELLPEAVEAAPAEATVCVFHSYTVNQFPPEARERLRAVIAQEAASKEQFYHLSAEWFDSPQPELELTLFRNGQSDHHLLAYCEAHGRWIEWLDDTIKPF